MPSAAPRTPKVQDLAMRHLSIVCYWLTERRLWLSAVCVNKLARACVLLSLRARWAPPVVRPAQRRFSAAYTSLVHRWLEAFRRLQFARLTGLTGFTLDKR